MWKYLLIGVALLIFACGTQTLQAQTACADHESIVDKLAADYGESKNGAGLVNEELAVEVFTNPKTGTWTILSVNANGVACLVASGQVWLDFEPVVGPTGEPM